MLKCFKNEKLWCCDGNRQEDHNCKEDPRTGCIWSGKGHEAAERCKGYIPEYEGRGTGYLLRRKGKGRHRQRS